MSFIYPQFLWALSALSIPLIIHLFNFRRYKTIYFSNLRFLQKVEKNSRSINRLRQLLIMLLRMLAIAALVIAFAQPFVPGGLSNQKELNKAVIYIDNSPSMSLEGSSGTLLNQARQKAVDLIKSLPNGFEYQLLTNNFNGFDQRFHDKNVTIEHIDQIDLSYAFRSGSQIFERISGNLNDLGLDTNQEIPIFLLSDFPKNAFAKYSPIKGTKLFPISLAPQREEANVAIDSAWLQNPVLINGLPQEITVRVKNYSNQKVNSGSIELIINGQRADQNQIDIDGSSFADVSFEFYPEGEDYLNAELRILENDPAFDNSFYMHVKANKPKSVAVFTDEESQERISRNFKDSLFSINFNNAQNPIYQAIASADLTIIHKNIQLSDGIVNNIKSGLEAGHNYFIIPERNSAQTANEILTQLGLKPLAALQKQKLRTNKINYKDPYFENTFLQEVKNPDLPKVKAHYPISLSQSYNLLTLENGAPLVVRLPVKNGQLFISAVPLDDSTSNLWQHIVARPLLMNAAMYNGTSQKAYLRSGQPNGFVPIEIDGQTENPLKLKLPEIEIIPPQVGNKLFMPPSELAPGHYPITQTDSLKGYLAINIDKRESELAYLENEALKDLFLLSRDQVLDAQQNNWDKQITDGLNGISLWKWFLIGALFFLVLEMALIKLW